LSGQGKSDAPRGPVTRSQLHVSLAQTGLLPRAGKLEGWNCPDVDIANVVNIG